MYFATDYPLILEQDHIQIIELICLKEIPSQNNIATVTLLLLTTESTQGADIMRNVPFSNKKNVSKF